ncbi:peroxide stress protein YaaA [Salipiger sp. IMCC34102]|uniref:peroxide stress protein YaaA n=1 Tax=Salipiger sp. IMCC34102 TaxID=2510647 RepID=UPI00101D9AEF|nr:peroxide stress protein YaaA [Salipiger sp. IMCC34102]RYH01540.1 peroxide stress protein YaaA [Salipiger sp. IMCC34102]
MLVTISPAKSLDLSPVDIRMTEPAFKADAIRLAKTMRGQTLADLKGLMGLSDDLARLNRDRFRDFAEDPDPEATRPAAFAFDGDTYKGLEARTLEPDDLAYAQDHLCILSGLYGILRPCDAIQPYRLEMGSRLKTRRGKTLTDYWGDTLAKALNRQAGDLGTDTLINCASQEYFSAVDRPALKLRVVTPRFLEVKDDRPRMVSFFAKRARGAMARFIVTHRLSDPEELAVFTTGGYAFAPDLSEPDQPTFLRPYPSQS